MENNALAQYFSGVWKEDMSYPFSGETLVDRVNNLSPKRVLDVGCGYNFFKNKIKNLVGLDPYNEYADIKDFIETFESTEVYDVILALGSINFGKFEDIKLQLKKIDSLLSPGGYLFFRVNPGLPHDWAKEESKDIEFFPWDLNFIIEYCKTFDYKLLEYRTEFNKYNSKRLFFVLKK